MEKRSLTIKDSCLALFIAFAISQLAIIFCTLITKAILVAFKYSQTRADAFINNATGYLILAIAQAISFIAVYLYYCKKTSLCHQSFGNKIDIKKTVVFIALGLGSLFCLNYFVNYYTTLINLLNKPSSTTTFAINNWKSYLLSLISLAMLPAIGEELLFRGVILNGLKSKGNVFAIIISSVLFTLFHFNLSQLFYPMCFGMLLGISFVCTRNIIVPILMHFFNNGVNITIMFIANKKGLTLFEISKTKDIFMCITLVAWLIIFAIALYILYRNEKNEKLVIENSEKDVNSKVEIESKQKDKKKNWVVGYASTRNVKNVILKNEKFWIALPLVIMGILYLALAVV